MYTDRWCCYRAGLRDDCNGSTSLHGVCSVEKQTKELQTTDKYVTLKCLSPTIVMCGAAESRPVVSQSDLSPRSLEDSCSSPLTAVCFLHDRSKIVNITADNCLFMK